MEAKQARSIAMVEAGHATTMRKVFDEIEQAAGNGLFEITVNPRLSGHVQKELHRLGYEAYDCPDGTCIKWS
jgi:hypothetical protein